MTLGATQPRVMKYDPRSCERNLRNCVRSLGKKSALQRGLNPRPSAML